MNAREWCDLVQSALLASVLHKLESSNCMTPPPSLPVVLQLQMADPCPAVLQSPYQVCSGSSLNQRPVMFDLYYVCSEHLPFVPKLSSICNLSAVTRTYSHCTSATSVQACRWLWKELGHHIEFESGTSNNAANSWGQT